MKRIFDLSIVLLALPILMLIGLSVALLVRLRLGKPVLFRQKRPGLNGVPFEMLKFRSMNEALNESGQLLTDEQRLPKFGRWLRSTSLDELPEFWNVLKGDMSLVGPRPLLMQYLPRYNARQARRHEVKPGLTGLAQVSGRNSITWEQKFELDVWYVDHHSLALDLRLLANTLIKVVKREGVNASNQQTMPEFLGSGSTTDNNGPPGFPVTLP